MFTWYMGRSGLERRERNFHSMYHNQLSHRGYLRFEANIVLIFGLKPVSYRTPTAESRRGPDESHLVAGDVQRAWVRALWGWYS